MSCILDFECITLNKLTTMDTTNKTNKKSKQANLTEDDLKALGDRAGNLRNDGAADQQLKQRKQPVDFEGKDLDVPGRSQATQSLKDEENKLYSRAGEADIELEQNA